MTPTPTPRRPRVPGLLDDAAQWAWRVLLLGFAVYVLGRVAGRLEIVVIPLLSALLIAALLQPLARLVRRTKLPSGLSALVTVLIALAVLGGIGTFVVNRAIVQYPQLADQVSDLVNKGQHYLEGPPLRLRFNGSSDPGKAVSNFLQGNKGQIAGGVVDASRTAVDVVTSLVLTLFLTIFMLYDGRRIWMWLTGLTPKDSRARVDHVGEQMWSTVTGYVSGTFLVALFHGVVIGVTLAVVGVPLVIPLAVLVFIGGFIPLIGVVVFGGLAVLVALITQGPTAGLVVLIVLVVENQVESHVLQPFVVGRHVSLHPMAIALTLASGAVLAGLPGAIFAVPIVAALNAAAKALRDPVVETGELPSAEAVENHTPAAADRREAERGTATGAQRRDDELRDGTGFEGPDSRAVGSRVAVGVAAPTSRVAPADLPGSGQAGSHGGHHEGHVES